MIRCKSCLGTIESGQYCAMCLGIAHCQEQVQSGYQQFLASLPAYEDEIAKIIDRVNRFDIPGDRLAEFQAMCEHHFTIELRKDDVHVTLCQTCASDIHPF